MEYVLSRSADYTRKIAPPKKKKMLVSEPEWGRDPKRQAIWSRAFFL